MAKENQKVKKLYFDLIKKNKLPFPEAGKSLNAPKEWGVYIIRKGLTALHVGRTPRAKNGIHQRLKDHLHGRSSFAREYLNGNSQELRKKGYTYQCIEVRDPRKRALLEAYAIADLCPKHLGLGE